MSATALDTIRIYCKTKEQSESYEADVALDLAVTELLAGLNDDRYLPELAAGERWDIVHVPTGTGLPPNGKLDEYDIKDGDQLDFVREHHGAGAAR